MNENTPLESHTAEIIADTKESIFKKNLTDFNSLGKLVAPSIKYTKNWVKIEIYTNAMYGIGITKEYPNSKNWKLPQTSNIELRFDEIDWRFRAKVRGVNDKDLDSIKVWDKNRWKESTHWEELTDIEAMEYIKAIKDRVTDYQTIELRKETDRKNKYMKKFVELSINQDKKEADTILENIEEQKA